MSALPSLRQLRYLVAVSDKLNFTQAAESCFVTQSTSGHVTPSGR